MSEHRRIDPIIIRGSDARKRLEQLEAENLQLRTQIEDYGCMTRLRAEAALVIIEAEDIAGQIKGLARRIRAAMAEA